MKKFCLFICLIFFVPQINAAGQTVTITVDPASDVSGNSETPDGLGVATLDPANNTVNVIGNNINTTYSIAGGRISSAVSFSEVSGNTVNILGDDSTFAEVYGGIISYSGNNGNVINNTINISGNNLTFNKIIRGGTSSGLGSINNNTINIGGSVSTFNDNNFGGYTLGSQINADGNTVNISESSNNSYAGSVITGGRGASANNNKVIIKSGTFIQSATTIRGGNGGGSTAVNVGSANNNLVDLSNITFMASGTVIAGGHAHTIANDNNVKINKLSFTGSTTIRGGWAESPGQQAPDSFEASGNNVYIEDSDISGSISGGEITGNSRDNTLVKVQNNTLNIKGGSYSGNLYGGNASRGTTSATNLAGIVQSNGVNISGSNIVGSAIYGGRGGVVNNNYVVIKDGNLENTKVYGGYSDGSSTATDVSFEASGNSVSINGGVIGGEIYGGFSYLQAGSTAPVNNNTVSISGNVDLSNASLFGGFATDGNSTSSGTGNTLNLASSITLLKVANFDNYNFYITGSNNTSPIMHTTFEQTDMSGTTIGLYLQEGINANFKIGDTIWLAENIKGDEDSLNQSSRYVRQGVAKIYDWDIHITGDNLYAVINKDVYVSTDGGANPEAKSLLEGNLSSLGMLISGADLIADSGVRSLEAALFNKSTGIFTSGSFNSQKLNSGSYAKVNSTSFILGLGHTTKNNNIWGLFLEYSNANHNTFNKIEDYELQGGSIVKGNGTNIYTGLGYLGRMSFNSMYFDSSLRGGYVATTHNADYTVGAEYNIGTFYYGGHLRYGYMHNIKNIEMTEYVQYLATLQQGKTTTLSSREKIKFASMLSSIVSIGGRAKYNGMYLGYAYEQELAGESKASIEGLVVNPATIKGGTNVVETGYEQNFVKLYSRSAPGKGFGIGSTSIGLGGKYYIGVRNGYSINAKFGYMF